MAGPNPLSDLIPPWVRWIAVDDDGTVRGFSTRPHFVRGHWESTLSEHPIACGDVFPHEAVHAQPMHGGNGQLYRLPALHSNLAARVPAWLLWAGIVGASTVLGYALWLVCVPIFFPT